MTALDKHPEKNLIRLQLSQNSVLKSLDAEAMAELERLTKRKEDIEFEINNISKSGKLTLDGKPKGDDRFSSTQKYFQNIGRNILEKQQQQNNAQTAFG